MLENLCCLCVLRMEYVIVRKGHYRHIWQLLISVYTEYFHTSTRTTPSSPALLPSADWPGANLQLSHRLQESQEELVKSEGVALARKSTEQVKIKN